jgi:hypothetical protein
MELLDMELLDKRHFLMDIIPRNLSDLSTAKHSFGLCDLPSDPYLKALVIGFDGEAGNSREHFGSFAAMRAMIAAGVAAWEPAAVVLDLQRLTYEWGDNMAWVLTAAYPLPTAVAVSDRSRDGLTSLVRKEMFDNPGKWLFESVKQAIEAVDHAVRGRRTYRGPAPFNGDPPEPESVTCRLALADLVGRMRADHRTDPDGWENPTLESFLGALASYLEDVPGYLKNVGSSIDQEAPSWQLFALVLAGARVYE